MAAKFESLIQSAARSEVAPVSGRPAEVSSGRNLADEPTMRVRALPVVAAPEREAAQVRVGRALVALRQAERDERLAAARELGDIAFVEGAKIPEAVVPLAVTLKGDPDAAVRQEAAWSLWKLGDSRGHKALMAALARDPAVKVREKAARALGLLGAREAVPLMLDLLSLGKHLQARLRAALAASLGFLADSRAMGLLMQSASDAEPVVRCESVRSLGRFLVGFSPAITEAVFRALEKFTRPRSEPQGLVRQAAIKGLRLSHEPRANHVVAKMLVGDPDPATRGEAAESLLLWNSAVSEAALIDALADDSWQVRKAAARSLARFTSRYRVYNSSAVCEAFARMTRMFPSFSMERRLAAEALASL